MPYTVTDEATGEALHVFEEGKYANALYAGARAAARLQREGRTVLLSGPEGFPTRRYAPEYATGTARWQYRVRACSVPGCLNWMHPRQVNPGAVCREHFRQAPETAARVDRMNEARRRKREER